MEGKFVFDLSPYTFLLQKDSPSCATCDGTRLMLECKNSYKCSAGEECYLQVYKDKIGQLIFGGCATSAECRANNLPTRSDRSVELKTHNFQFFCGGCCSGRENCNMDICDMPLLGLYTGTPPILTTQIPLIPVPCETCSGLICGVVPGKTSMCPADKPFCMNTIVNTVSGQKQITKGCTSVSDCDTKWFHFSSRDKTCGTFDMRTIYPFDFTCSYCCLTPNCNKDIVPKDNTLYGMYIPPPVTTTTTTSGPTTPPTPVECQQCSGEICAALPYQPSVKCTADKPYCMNTVENFSNGTKTATKECASLSDCEVKWKKGSALDSNCKYYGPTSPSYSYLKCSYCCTKSHCNDKIVPSAETLY